MNFHEEARKLEMVREDRKWYENEAATEALLERTARYYYDRGVKDGMGVHAKPTYPPIEPIARDFYRGQAYEEG